MSNQQRARPRGPQQYRGNGEHGWEPVTKDGTTQRLRVPGGWIYACASYVDGRHSCVFVPVPEAVGYVV